MEPGVVRIRMPIPATLPVGVVSLDFDVVDGKIPSCEPSDVDSGVSDRIGILTTSYAEATDSETLFISAHSEDFSGYPDYHPAFFNAFQNVMDVETEPEMEIKLKARFAEWWKTEIAERGVRTRCSVRDDVVVLP